MKERGKNMYCMQCGKQLDEKTGVCPQCGTMTGGAGNMQITPPMPEQLGGKLTYSPQTKQSVPGKTAPKKGYGTLIAGICAAVVLIIAIVAGGLGFMHYQKERKLDEVIAGYQDIYDAVDERFARYIIEETNQEQLERYKGNLKLAIRNRDEEKCKYASDDLGELEEVVKTTTIDTVTALKEEIDEQGTGNLLSAEIQDYNIAKAQANQLYTEGKYLEARQQYNLCQGMLNSAGGVSDYTMDLRQVDVTDFPEIKLYLSVLNQNTSESVDALSSDKFLLREKVGNGEEYKELDIKSVNQMNKNSGLNTALVADVSASMKNDMYVAEDAMSSFIKSMQFEVNDKAALYSFSDYVNREQHFTSKETELEKAIKGLEMGNMTALYDALVYAISDIVVEDGAKCVIAFTDGMENNSNSTKDYVIQKAQQYDIPIYIIGIGGSVDSNALQEIADQTDGWYRNISNINSMADVYDEIYAVQKAMYVLQYTTQKKTKEKLSRDVYIRYSDDTITTSTESVYTPADYKISGYIFYDSDSRYLKETELDNLSEEEVLIALNELYARKGYKFQTNQFLIDHFNNCDWYHGKYKNQSVVEKKFNKYERKNKDMLVAYEKKHKLNNRK